MTLTCIILTTAIDEAQVAFDSCAFADETLLIINETITNYSQVRNEALGRATGDWVLFVDADEIITPELKEEITNILHLKSHIYSAYYLRRQDTFMGRKLKYGETGSAKFIRLAKKDFGHWVRPVHEVWQGKGKVGELQHSLLHNSHPTIASFVAKIDRYSTLDAEYRKSQGMESSLFKIAVYPIAKFKYNYLIKLGFLDGVPGLIMAIMMSLHSYLTWTKLYLLWRKQ